MSVVRFAPPALAVAALAVISWNGPALDGAKVGDKVPSFAMEKLLNGDGRNNLDEFRGQPVLVDFWGTH